MLSSPTGCFGFLTLARSKISIKGAVGRVQNQAAVCTPVQVLGYLVLDIGR
jgi:hypothetical protein